MIDLREELRGLKRIVVKVGSNVITKKNGKIDYRKMRIITEDICELVDNGIEVILVSSGAVSLGKSYLQKHMPKEGAIDLLHSASSIGQPRLIYTYSKLFEEDQKICSQLLLTHDDIRNRKRFLHVKQNLDVLLKNKVTPILNENDSISYNEISVGDNDHLAAQAAQMTNADALLIITSVAGLYDKDPTVDGAKLLNIIDYGSDLHAYDTSTKTETGRGGMASKLDAVTKVTPLGIKAIIASKDNFRIIMDPLTKDVGTFFSPGKTYDPELKKAWLIASKKTDCYIDIDEGARVALMEGKSLFAKGIVSTEGDFYKGDSVAIRYEGNIFAFGVAQYDSREIDQIKKKHSDDFEDILGFKTSCEVVNTENVVIDEEITYGNISEKI